MKISKSKDVVAGIVLYKPDFKRLNENLELLCQQFETVILYNNDADISKINITPKCIKKNKNYWKGKKFRNSICP